MNALTLSWLLFALCVALIGAAGPVLSRNADVIAEETGVSGSWIGLVVLASVTSLPELVLGASAIGLAHRPDIAIGDALGSCVFNLALVAVLDMALRGPGLFQVASRRHLLSAAFGVLLIGVVAVALLLPSGATGPTLGHVGLISPLLLLLYAVAMRSLFRHGGQDRHPASAPTPRSRSRLHGAIARYVGGAVVIVGSGIGLSLAAERVAELMGWQMSFMGSLFVAGATSMPELVVTLAAVRMGALDMAMANLLGSNLFDMVIVAIDDLLFMDGPVLRHVAPAHALSAVIAMGMTALVMLGLVSRPGGRLLRVGWIDVGLIGGYVLNLFALYRDT
ncbi:sodium:calcium antiporter [Oleiagrimonas sp. C23AA]|uniref:sodium:calcium antiporter n=1 Tax=Oleiagrimonas sp. C23AA TaxID=2719047 RepID=UPI001423DF0C|nr:sodium:calcium antiporter [Oleiagrimonas sp. C23AA]NII10019.1 sodium:calcium antiporter [Oleiagrimonas sp. C23AA]